MRLKGFTSISWWTIDFCFQNQPVNCVCVCLFSLYLRIDSFEPRFRWCGDFSANSNENKQSRGVKGERGYMKKRRRTRDTFPLMNPAVEFSISVPQTHSSIWIWVSNAPAIRFCWTAKRNRLPRPDKWIPAAGFIADIYQSENLIKVEGGKGEGSGMF